MNVNAELLKFYSEKERQFHFLYMELLRRCGDETVHDLRVNMKKQLAFFRLLEALDKDFFADQAAEVFTHFYKKAGKVRDLQVERQVVEAEEEALRLGHHFSLQLGRKEKLRTTELQRYEEEHSLEPVRALSKVVKNHIQTLPPEKLPARLEAYFGSLTGSNARLCEMGLRREEELHNLRRHIKELFYNLEVLDRILPAGFLDSPEYALLDELQNLLGEWHDYDFTLQKLDGKGPEEIIARMREDREERVQRIRRNLPALEGTLTQLDQEVRQLLRKARFSSPAPQPSKTGSRARDSFPQMNIGERYG